MTAQTTIQVISNPISAQFEALRDNIVVGLLGYDQAGNHFDLRHTFVPEEFRGQHIAETLVTQALDHIRGRGATIAPSCTYVAAFLERQPQYADLVGEYSSARLRPAVATPSRSRLPNGSKPTTDTVNVFPDTIVTARLTLRPWMLDDTDEAFEIYRMPEVTNWTRPFINTMTDRDTMRRKLTDWISESDQLPPPQGRWAIEVSETGILVGGAQLLMLPNDDTPRLLMSLELAPFATGHGLATEAGHAVIHSAFSIEPTLSTVYALSHPDNHHARATLGRIGFTTTAGTEHRYGADLTLHAMSRSDFEDIENAAPFSEESAGVATTTRL